ncbi:tail fiber assembly protein [Serratia sarumanii]|uniref:tail fiber assembly protein n=1 Tax=Serratia sarumanii TaxID=3020826 RepID=UPI003F7E2EB6
MNITSAINPRTKDAKAYIDLDITLEDGSVRPFTAMPTDPLGAELYKNAKNGIYGKVLISPNADYQWNGIQWIAPSKEALIAAAEVEKTSLMAVAEASIAPLERAVRLGIATKEEQALLTAWETYSVLLSRVNPNDAPNIDWPVRPE